MIDENLIDIKGMSTRQDGSLPQVLAMTNEISTARD